MVLESETIVGVKMKELAVFLLAVLGCSPAKGRIVSKCELRDQLVKATGNPTVQPNGLSGDNLVATRKCCLLLHY